MFIGREQELKYLEEKYLEEKGQLIVLYGRRRVGKTETLKKFCEDKPHIFYSCTQISDKAQLLRFSKTLLKEDIPARKYISEFEDWESAIGSVSELPYGEKKKLIVIDEFPYMCRGNKSIPSILQALWDDTLKDKNVMIILCGSSMSFIEKELLADKNPLYGRATGIYKMKAMGFYDAIGFFPDYTEKDKVLVYSILGGIPHYLKQFDPTLSVHDNIKKNILSKGCVLYSEVEFLLHQELRETALYNSIIEAVALGNTKLNDINQKALINDTSKTSVYIKNLMELGIVEREISVTAKKRDTQKAKNIYRLSDNFFRFWYTFGFSNISQLEDGDIDGVFDHIIKHELNEYASLSFEDVCKEYVREVQKKDKLPFRFARIGRWMGKTTVRDITKPGGKRTDETEIDILCVSSDEKKYLLGECKFKDTPFRYSEYLVLCAKEPFKQEKDEVYYGLFSASGFDEKIQNETLTHKNILLFDLEEIVNFRTAVGSVGI